MQTNFKGLDNRVHHAQASFKGFKDQVQHMQASFKGLKDQVQHAQASLKSLNTLCITFTAFLERFFKAHFMCNQFNYSVLQPSKNPSRPTGSQEGNVARRMGDRQPRRKTHARPARKTGGDSGEVEIFESKNK